MFQIFKAGTHIDSAGVKRKFTEQDVKDIARGYDPSLHRAPILINHDEKLPNKGIIQKVINFGKDLFVEPSPASPEFKEEAKNYAGVSAKFYTPEDPRNPTPGVWYLRHVALVNIPSVKGMPMPEFEEGDVVIEFSEPVQFMESSGWLGMLAQNLREYLLENGGSDVADRVVPSWMVEGLMAEKIQEIVEKNNEGESMAYSEQQVKDLEAREVRLAAREAEIESLRQQTLEASFSEFLNSSDVVKKVPVAEKPYLLATMKSLGGIEETVQFSEGESLTPLEAFKKSIASRPDLVEFGEFAKESKAASEPETDPVKIARKAQEYQFSEEQKGNKIGIAEAVEFIHKQEGIK